MRKPHFITAVVLAVAAIAGGLWSAAWKYHATTEALLLEVRAAIVPQKFGDLGTRVTSITPSRPNARSSSRRPRLWRR